MSTPAADGFFMPPEWAPHTRCWMAWPCRKDLWGSHLEAACDAYAEVAEAIAEFEPVTMIARGDEVASVSMRTGTKVATMPLPHDDSWMRDNGPTFVINSQGDVAGVDWVFNSWGEKYKPYDQDAAVAEALLGRLKIKRYAAPLVLEGGAIHVDGEGTCLTTEQCLLNPNRNPGMSKEEIEQHLKDYLGVSTVIWLAGDPLDTDTDGHVDGIACFAAPGKVLAVAPTRPDAPNAEALAENLRRLREARDAQGRELEILEVPQPQKAKWEEKDGLMIPSYVNFYLANEGGLILPVYEDPMDQKVIDLMEEAFPDRSVRPIPSMEIAYGGGMIHCITQQQPSGALE